jgi:phytoene dehydrogenase-like protein
LKAHSKTLVVGAGGGGMASALLASLRGEDVTLIEGHSKLGGCASWFKRGQFIFDAGATTLSGVSEHEPLGELFKLLGSRPPLKVCDPGITFHLSNGKVIRYHRDFERWMEELKKHFSDFNHRPFWEKVRRINHMSWELLRDVKTFPFRSWSDFTEVLKHPRYVSLVPYLLLSTEMALKSYNLFDESYLELINGVMIISAQGEARDIPFIVGAMALSYPSETYAIEGGMKGLMDYFQQELVKRNVEVLMRTKVIGLHNTSVKLQDGSDLSGDKIIMNVPVWNIAALSHDPQFQKEAEAKPGHWGALTLYFGVEGNFSDLYQQVHLKGEVENYFISFSLPGDLKRAPEGYQAVTISTHVAAGNFSQEDRIRFSEIILDDFKKRFNVSEVKFFLTGAPKTFERYTGRKSGFVGGLPFLYGKNPLNLLSPLTHLQNVYRVGDTVFPGQGLCGVVAGALELDHRLR